MLNTSRAVAFLVFLAMGVPVAGAATYDYMFVFGDSYCDVGNVFAATGKVYPAAPYYSGRYSNGPIWIEHVAGSLGLALKPSLSGGTDFAYGGAEATASQTVSGVTVPSVLAQVENYLKAHGGKADPKGLYVLEGGGNDILDSTGGSEAALASNIASAMSESELLLRRAGATHIVMPNLFDVSKLPAGQANAAFNHAVSLAANADLDKLLVPEESLTGVTIWRPDWYQITQAMLTDPTHLGFNNVASACFTTAVCKDPDHTWYWDTYHPTEFAHDVFAVQLEGLLAQ